MTIATYINDFMVLGPNKAIIVSMVELLGQELRVRDLGALSLFLSIEIQLNNNSIRISYKAKIQDIYKDLGLRICQGAKSPIANNGLIDRDPENLCNKEAATKHRSAIRSLLHIAIMTRPDIQYSVNRLA